ncbi:hypothetical protein F4824DRAFT_486847 [Ustulina deusta]|nr:hypothetical protein F4824DRAFT_486847 [Ustulina deusta]
MQYIKFLFGLIWAVGACARYNQYIAKETQINNHDAPVDEISLPLVARDSPKPSRDLSQLPRNQVNRRDNYPINCHLHNWPSASVKSIKEAYSWFYQLWAPLEADAQHCRRIACFGVSGVWLCADSLDYQKPNSVKIADKMNELLDRDSGCLDKGDSSMVQGQYGILLGWTVMHLDILKGLLVREKLPA